MRSRKKSRQNFAKDNSNNNITNVDYEYLSYMVDFAELKYKEEVNRENAIIQQAATMQAAFSFVTAAIVMVIPVVCEYRGNVSLDYYLFVFSTVIGTLMFSLFSATKALARRKSEAFLDVEDMNVFIEKNKSDLSTEEQRNRHYAEYLGKVQKSLVVNNDERVRWLRCSQYVFYGSLILCLVWFLVTLFKMYG